MNEQDFRRIADKTNKIMKPYFTLSNRPGSKSDIVIMDPHNSWIWEACEPYLQHLPEVFEQWKRENEGDPNLDVTNFNPYIKTLNDFGIIKKLFKRIDMLVVKERMKRDRIVLEHWDLAVDMMKDSPFNLIDDLTSVGVEYKAPKNETLSNGQTLSDWSPTPREEKAVLYRVSEQILKECKIRSIDDYE